MGDAVAAQIAQVGSVKACLVLKIPPVFFPKKSIIEKDPKKKSIISEREYVAPGRMAGITLPLTVTDTENKGSLSY